MASTQTNQYLKTQVMTATREQLMLLLYDGCIRFCEQAKVKIDEKDIEGSYTLLIKAKNIVFELMRTLNYDVDKEFCTNIGALYNYMYRLLIEANIAKQKEPIDEVITLLKSLREAWQEAINKLQQEGGLTALQRPDSGQKAGIAGPGRARTPALPPGGLNVSG